jgi:hypothetical protein
LAISKAAKEIFKQQVEQHKNIIQQIDKEILSLKDSLADEETNKYEVFLKVVDKELTIASYYIVMNSLSVQLLGLKNDTYLNEARKSTLRAVLYGERIASDVKSGPFKDYEENLISIQYINPKDRWSMIRKYGFTIDSIKEAYGKKSRFADFIVELEARFYVIAKNLIDFRRWNIFDPTTPYYHEMRKIIDITAAGLNETAEKYRYFYEQSRIKEDFQRAYGQLGALARLYSYSSQNDKYEDVKTKMKVWKKIFNEYEGKKVEA